MFVRIEKKIHFLTWVYLILKKLLLKYGNQHMAKKNSL